MRASFAFLFQSELDRFYRIGEFYRIAFALICLYQCCQNVQLVAFCRTCGGIPQLLHPAQCPLVIGFPSKRALLSVAALKICLRQTGLLKLLYLQIAVQAGKISIGWSRRSVRAKE